MVDGEAGRKGHRNRRRAVGVIGAGVAAAGRPDGGSVWALGRLAFLIEHNREPAGTFVRFMPADCAHSNR